MGRISGIRVDFLIPSLFLVLVLTFVFSPRFFSFWQFSFVLACILRMRRLPNRKQQNSDIIPTDLVSNNSLENVNTIDQSYNHEIDI